MIADCQSARAGPGERAFVSPKALWWRVGNPRYSAARPSRNQIVLILDCPVSDYEDDDEDEDEKFARPATIRTDTDRLGSLRYEGVCCGACSADSRVCCIADCQSAWVRKARARHFARDECGWLATRDSSDLAFCATAGAVHPVDFWMTSINLHANAMLSMRRLGWIGLTAIFTNCRRFNSMPGKSGVNFSLCPPVISELRRVSRRRFRDCAALCSVAKLEEGGGGTGRAKEVAQWPKTSRIHQLILKESSGFQGTCRLRK